MANKIQNSFCEIIDKALLGLRRCDMINAKTREEINGILLKKIKWEE